VPGEFMGRHFLLTRLPGIFLKCRPGFLQIGTLCFPLRGKYGQEWIRTTEGVSQRIYSPPRLP